MKADTYPLQVLLWTFSGWLNRHQQDVIAYLIEEPGPERAVERSAASSDRRAAATTRREGQTSGEEDAQSSCNHCHSGYDHAMAQAVDRSQVDRAA